MSLNYFGENFIKKFLRHYHGMRFDLEIWTQGGGGNKWYWEEGI